MTSLGNPYPELLKHAREIAFFNSATNVLSWDQEVGMPAQALPFRAAQLAFLSGEAHRRFTGKPFGDLLSACEQQGFAANSLEAANLRGWRRRFDRARQLPAQLVEDSTRICTLAREAWGEARKQSDFKLFQPHLEKIVALARQKADHWGFTGSPYDALLAGYEPGVTTADIRRLFAELRPALRDILTAARARSSTVPADLLAGDYPLAAQQVLNQRLAAAVGFDFGAGRLDTSVHPFCDPLGPGDCRLTTRYDPVDFTSSFYGVLHEVGHGLYEQGLNREWYGTPMGSAASEGIHESQSRLWENHVGRTRGFWRHWQPLAGEHFPALRHFSPAQIVAAINRVSPSLIRIESDPVTYDLHILLRFEIEVRLVEGSLPVADVPAFWNEQCQQLLGLQVPRDAEGCLQDIHWSTGAFGYFPTYTLGNLHAAQLMQRAGQDIPGLNAGLERGDYAPLLNWLRTKVHSQGARYLPSELIQHVCGEPSGAAAHLAYLRREFL